VIEQNPKNKTITCGVFSNETLLTTGTGTSIREASEKVYIIQ
jgi:dsRNA-specific ribonuclease